ncbi:hypothetical protein FGO68_gene4671 [Halteria grandinella]|uniref:Glycosyltransferase 2-like domain-containing protein n=1 Tax=Halteria grandinella TaxID=5974 RepID=A0A8J8P7Y6_HALGN|nr:hypothetical protein FGO68_gene4671 [Halteria grandinella]
MSSYNRGPYLQRAIESIFNSTYTNWEIVIVDDGSHKQETIEILNSYLDHPKIKVHKLYHNYGSGIFAKNYGFLHAQGDYMTIVDDDDTVYPESFQQMVEYLESNKEIDILVGFASIEQNFQVSKWKGKFEEDSHEVFKYRMLFGNLVSCCAQMVRRERLKEKFIFNYIGAEDYDLYLRLLFGNDDSSNDVKYARIPIPTCKVTIDSNDRISDTQHIVETWKWIPRKTFEAFKLMFPQDNMTFEDYNAIRPLINCIQRDSLICGELNRPAQFIVQKLQSFRDYILEQSESNIKLIELADYISIQVVKAQSLLAYPDTKDLILESGCNQQIIRKDWQTNSTRANLMP